MSKILENLKYTKTHEWVKLEGDIATVGITDFAQASLGEIVYAESYEIDEHVSQGEECGAVESVKAASDLNAPMSGTVVEINDEVIASPEKINQDPYNSWILKIKVDDVSELDNLLSNTEYEKEAK